MSWLVYCKPNQRHIDTYPRTVYPHTVWCPCCHEHVPVSRIRRADRQRLPTHFLISRNQRGMAQRLRGMGYTRHNGEETP